jgi:hypothetical protein
VVCRSELAADASCFFIFSHAKVYQPSGIPHLFVNTQLGCLCLAVLGFDLSQAMENSIEMDYVSEKVYHALESGCVPIYYGAPNVLEYVPEPQSIINYAKLGSPSALLTELEHLVEDDTAYNAKLAWKSKTIEQLSTGMSLQVTPR